MADGPQTRVRAISFNQGELPGLSLNGFCGGTRWGNALKTGINGGQNVYVQNLTSLPWVLPSVESLKPFTTTRVILLWPSGFTIRFLYVTTVFKRTWGQRLHLISSCFQLAKKEVACRPVGDPPAVLSETFHPEEHAKLQFMERHLFTEGGLTGDEAKHHLILAESCRSGQNLEVETGMKGWGSCPVTSSGKRLNNPWFPHQKNWFTINNVHGWESGWGTGTEKEWK